MKKKFLEFKEARKIARELNLRKAKDWTKTKSNNIILQNIPSRPKEYYKKKWKGWNDWLGSDFREYLSFNDARDYVRKLGLNSYAEWIRWCKSEAKPNNIPCNVIETYKKEWTDWYDFLGKRDRKEFLSYYAARKLVRKLEIKRQEGYYELSKRRSDLPYNPDQVYKQWKDWFTFLGTDRRNKIRKYTVNHNYFKKWSGDMAYILGLWFADGHINGNLFTLALHKDEDYLIKEILLKMGANNKLYYTPYKNMCCVYLYSPDITDDVRKIFINEKKYARHKFPYIPKKYLPDFIRGFWDGDGTIYCNKNSKDFRSALCCADLELIKQTHNILKKNIKDLKGYIGQTIQKKGKIIQGHPLKRESIVYQIRLGNNDTRRLRAFMYYDGCLKMQRKYDKFVEAGDLRPYNRKI